MIQSNNLNDGFYNELNVHSLVEELRYYIAKLPNHFREVIMLRDMAELSYAQVGRILGISAGTARVYRCKAVQLLAVWMGTNESI
jgi:DNA-directed RNA polymerase specialized sigma24 family protein